MPELTRTAFNSLKTGMSPAQPPPPKYDKRFQEIFDSRDLRMGVSLTKEEIYTLYSSVLSVSRLEGGVAEVGVYRGGSAKVICEVKGSKPLYLFDTFEGMPDDKISEGIDGWEKGTHTGTSLEEVRVYLNEYPKIHYIQGIFPASLSQHQELAIEKQLFSFVHLDVDLYKSTLDALKFFYPRMVRGGRIVSHNYNLQNRNDGMSTPGVKFAFMEYFKGREHHIIEIAETQCMVIKN